MIRNPRESDPAKAARFEWRVTESRVMTSPFLTHQQAFLPHGYSVGQQPALRHPAAGGDVGDRGKWTSEEHSSFLRALEEIVASTSDGNDWEAIARAVGRSEEDVKRHAQHYFLKLEHERSVPAENILQVCLLAVLKRVTFTLPTTLLVVDPTGNEFCWPRRLVLGICCRVSFTTVWPQHNCWHKSWFTLTKLFFCVLPAVLQNQSGGEGTGLFIVPHIGMDTDKSSVDGVLPCSNKKTTHMQTHANVKSHAFVRACVLLRAGEDAHFVVVIAN